MKRLLATIALSGLMILVAVIIVSALDEPEGFKDLKFGDSEQAVRVKLKAARSTGDPFCFGFSKDTLWVGDRSCSSPSTIGDIYVGVRYTFRADKLVRISFSFKPAAYPEMRTAFTTRFGPPTETKQTPVKTGAGVEYLNEELTWTGPTVQVYLAKYFNKVTEAGATYHLLTDMAAASALRRQQGTKAAEDLK